jgi:5-methylcytosine-specific restriction endonuclease McrA
VLTLAQLVAKHGKFCWLCGGKRTHKDPFTADHVIPKSLGGPDTLENLLPACRSCNSSRGALFNEEILALAAQVDVYGVKK